MEFIVPKFIEREAKIVGPFTFKQFIFIGAAGGLCLLLYFVLPISVFVIVAVILLGGAFSLAFLKIKKTSLPIFIKNFFIFLSRPKVYLWKKKGIPPKILKKEKKAIREEKEIRKEPGLKIARDSKLSELFTRIETK